MPTHPQPESSGLSNAPHPGVNSETAVQTELIGRLAVAWGICGVVLLLSFAIFRLSSISIAAFGFTLSWSHWAVLFASVLFMAYTEGYRTFQKIWAPRVVGRAFELKQNWTPLRLLLAPLYSMSFFHATRKRCTVAWATTLCIVLLVIFMNQLAQPWRGLIDAGVVVGLTWGVLSVVIQSVYRLKAA